MVYISLIDKGIVILIELILWAPCFANLSAQSLNKIPQWEGTQHKLQCTSGN